MATSVPKQVQSGALSNTNVFNEVTDVASGATVTVVTFTVPVGKKLLLSLIEFSGENIAEYEVFIDSSTEGKKLTYFSGPLAGDFFFNNLEISTGIVIELKVRNFRPETADFTGRILGTVQDE